VFVGLAVLGVSVVLLKERLLPSTPQQASQPMVPAAAETKLTFEVSRGVYPSTVFAKSHAYIKVINRSPVPCTAMRLTLDKYYSASLSETLDGPPFAPNPPSLAPGADVRIIDSEAINSLYKLPFKDPQGRVLSGFSGTLEISCSEGAAEIH
jgi:hypothetical protein